MTAKRRSKGKGDRQTGPKTRPQEQLLIEEICEIRQRRILCTSAGRAQFARAVAEQLPESEVCCHYLDIFQAERARRFHRDGPENLSIVCTADFPEDEVDLVAFPFSAGGEAELTRDLMQTGHQRLAIGGRMWASTDNPDDTWLQEQMRKLFPKVTRRSFNSGALYLATKTEPLKKFKNFECEFAFRDRERLIQAVSRPGVFSHRKLDAGSRALINEMVVEDGFQILDLGCGSGVVGFAAAFRARDVRVHAVDSNARAVECTQKGAELNGLQNVTVQLDAEGTPQGAGSPETGGEYDLVLANPPYFSHYRIGAIFLEAALKALKPGGRVQVVAKKPDWYVDRMIELFDGVGLRKSGQYFVVTGEQRNGRN